MFALTVRGVGASRPKGFRGLRFGVVGFPSSSFWGLPYRILNVNHKKGLLRGLWLRCR